MKYSVNSDKTLLSSSPSTVIAQPGDILKITVYGITQTEDSNNLGKYYYKMNIPVYNKNVWSGTDNRILVLSGWTNSNGSNEVGSWTIEDGKLTAIIYHELIENDMPTEANGGTFYVRSYGDSPETGFQVEIISGSNALERASMESYANQAALIKSGIILNEDNDWTYSSIDDIMLPSYSPDGIKYSYFALERPLDGYDDEYIQRYNGTLVKNKPSSENLETGLLCITKEVEGLSSALASGKTFHFTVSKNGYYYDRNGSYGVNPAEHVHEIVRKPDGTYSEVTFENMPVGNYTVEEVLQGAEIPYYRLTSVVKVGDEIKDDGNVSVEKDDTTAAIIENTYTRGVEQTSIDLHKSWTDTENNSITTLPSDASATFILKRYYEEWDETLNEGDGGYTKVEDEIDWNASDYIITLDGEADAGEIEPWHYRWDSLDKVYWDYDAEQYRDYIYEIEETSITYNGLTTDLTQGETNAWRVTTQQDGYEWTVTNTPNTQRIVIKKVWQDAMGNPLGSSDEVPEEPLVEELEQEPDEELGEESAQETDEGPGEESAQESNEEPGDEPVEENPDGLVGDPEEELEEDTLAPIIWPSDTEKKAAAEAMPDGTVIEQNVKARKIAEAYIPIILVMSKSINISGVGIKNYEDVLEFQLVPDNDRLAALNASTGVTVTYDNGNFIIDGLEDEGTVIIGTNEYKGKWTYSFKEKTLEGYEEVEYSNSDPYASEQSAVYHGGTLTNHQSTAKEKLWVKKRLTLSDGETEYAEWPEEGFTFALELLSSNNADCVVMPESASITIQKETKSSESLSSADRKASFGDISFKKAGTYTFAITETAASIPNITCDSTPHAAIVVVKEEDGKFYIESVKYDYDPLDETSGTNELVITNKHEVQGAIPFKVKKTFVGGTFEDETFEFMLTQVEKMNTTTQATTKLSSPVTVSTPDEDVSEKIMTFNTEITFNSTETGEYFFKIEEVQPDTPYPTIKYDSTPQWIKVTVNNGVVTKTYANVRTIESGEPDASFTNEKLVNVTATKKWVDSDGTTPLEVEPDTEITLQLTQWKGNEQSSVLDFAPLTVTLDGEIDTEGKAIGETGYMGQEGPNWTYTWSGLPKAYYDDSKGEYLDYEYQIEETCVKWGSGTEKRVANDITEDGMFLVYVDETTITNKLNTKSVEFGKQWMDKDGKAVEWPSHANEENSEEDESGGLSYEQISVTLHRKDDSGYSESMNLSPSTDKVTIDGKECPVTWTLPSYGDSNKVYWFTIDGLTQYQPDGVTQWRYYVTEDEPKIDDKTYLVKYSQESDGAHERVRIYDAKQYIINRYPETEIKISKEWYNSVGKEEKEWPNGKELSLTLYRKQGTDNQKKLVTFNNVKPGDNNISVTVTPSQAEPENLEESSSSESGENTGAVTEYTLSCCPDYPFIFEVDGLPLADEEGNIYTYYFQEENLPGYETTYGNGGTYLGKTDAAYNGGKIINTMPATEFCFNKLWKNDVDGDVQWPKDANIEITLYGGNEEFATADLSEQGGTMGSYTWIAEEGEYSSSVRFTVTGLPKYNENGQEINYHVVETGVDEDTGHHKASYYRLEKSSSNEDENEGEDEDPDLMDETTKTITNANKDFAMNGQYIVNRPYNDEVKSLELPATGSRFTPVHLRIIASILIILAGVGMSFWRY